MKRQFTVVHVANLATQALTGYLRSSSFHRRIGLAVGCPRSSRIRRDASSPVREEWNDDGAPRSPRRPRIRRRPGVPGYPVEAPLTLWSQLGEWFAHPAVGPALQALIKERGGIRGRVGDLLSDPVGRDMVLVAPMIGITEFPGFPLTNDEAEGLLALG